MTLVLEGTKLPFLVWTDHKNLEYISVSQETELPPGPVVTLSDQIQLFPLILAGVPQRQTWYLVSAVPGRGEGGWRTWYHSSALTSHRHLNLGGGGEGQSRHPGPAHTQFVKVCVSMTHSVTQSTKAPRQPWSMPRLQQYRWCVQRNTATPDSKGQLPMLCLLIAKKQNKMMNRDERVQHYLYLYLLTVWIICICICTRSGRGLTRKWAGFNPEVGRLSWNERGFNRYVILSMQLIWVDQKLLFIAD